VSMKDAQNAPKDQQGFASHMVEGVDVPFLGVTRELETSFIVLLTVVESDVDLMGVTNRLSVALAFVQPMGAVADVQSMVVTSLLNLLPCTVSSMVVERSAHILIVKRSHGEELNSVQR
jgi:hypothetical protein